MTQSTRDTQPIVEIEVPCGKRHKHKVLIYVESWDGRWLVPQRLCQREGLLGSVYRAFQVFAPCFRHLRKRIAETRRAIVIQMLANPSVFENQILGALDDTDDEIRLMILQSLPHFAPELRKRILEKIILHQSVTKPIIQIAVSKLRQCTPDEQVEIIKKIWHVETLEKIGVLEEIIDMLVRCNVPKSIDMLLKDVHRCQHQTREKLKEALTRKSSQHPQLVAERLRILVERQEKILNDDSKILIIDELISVLSQGVIDQAVDLLNLLTKDASSRIRLAAYRKLSQFHGKHINWLSIFVGGLCDGNPEVVNFVFSKLKSHKICVPEDMVCPNPTANVHVLLLMLRIVSGDMASVDALLAAVLEHGDRMWKWVQDEAAKVIAASRVDLSDRILNILLDQRQSDDRRVVCLQIIYEMCSDDSSRQIVANNHELRRVLEQIHRRSLHLESAKLARATIEKIGGDNHAR